MLRNEKFSVFSWLNLGSNGGKRYCLFHKLVQLYTSLVFVRDLFTLTLACFQFWKCLFYREQKFISDNILSVDLVFIGHISLIFSTLVCYDVGIKTFIHRIIPEKQFLRQSIKCGILKAFILEFLLILCEKNKAQRNEATYPKQLVTELSDFKAVAFPTLPLQASLISTLVLTSFFSKVRILSPFQGLVRIN